MALLCSLLCDSLAAIGLLLIALYFYGTAQFNFFKKRGIPFEPPVPFFGNFTSVVRGQESMQTAIQRLYQKFKKNRIFGAFQGRMPAVVVCDPELVKMILTKDFSSVHDRGIPFDEENDPLSANLVNLPGARWKNLRTKLTPTFTSGKLKMMFPLMKECSSELNDYLRESAVQGKEVELLQPIIRYCTDVVGTCAFGIQCNSIKNPSSEFYVTSRAIFKPSILGSLRFAIFSSSKLLMKLIPFKLIFPGVHKFFLDLMKDTVSYRRKNKVVRNDFVHLLMQQQDNDKSKSPKDYPDEVVFTDDILTAQAFLFFVAGLDSIANNIALSLYHISIDPRLQEDLADEVISVIRNNNGELNYDTLKEMKLCERIVSETLRMYTPGGVLFREVTSPTYTLPGTDLTLKKDTKILIPVQGLHYDPEIFPNPEKFDPDRFTEEAISKRHPYAYLPFGEGPRVCIANRFALLESKLGLASLIRDFKFSVSPKTPIPLELETRSFGPSPKGGLVHLKIEVRSQ